MGASFSGITAVTQKPGRALDETPRGPPPVEGPAGLAPLAAHQLDVQSQIPGLLGEAAQRDLELVQFPAEKRAGQRGERDG